MIQKFSTIGVKNLIQEQLHPNSLNNFCIIEVAVPLQNDACAIFAKEKSKSRARKSYKKNDMTTNDSKQHLQTEGKQQDIPSLQF